MDNTKLKEIGDAISDIRKHLGADCTPLKDLPGLVAELTSDSSKNGFSTIFLFSDIANPNIPKCSTIDVSTGIADLNEDPQGYQIKETFSENNIIFITWAVFDKFGQKITEGSKPVNIKGKNGEQGTPGQDGAPGKDGEDGKDGQDGENGMDGTVNEYVYFRGFVSEHIPTRPTSGVGNDIDDYVPTEQKVVTIKDKNYTLSWSDKAQGIDAVYMFEWRSERTKEGSIGSDFSEPILGAKYGEKGKDGDGVQYIFTVTEKNSIPDNPTPYDGETSSTYQNKESEEYIPNGGSDDPIEVDSTNKYCGTSIRKYRNEKWGMYSTPTLGTKWIDTSAVTGDVVVVDMDPDFAMINVDDKSVETTITAFRGDDSIIIQDVTCEQGDYTCDIIASNDKKTWNVVVSNVTDSVAVKINVKLSETSTRTKTFNIYHTKNDSETVSVDFGDDNILVPCSDGSTPDSGFFNNLEIPVMMRVGGKIVTVKSITPDKNAECFELTSAGNIKVKDFPGNAQKTSIKFTVSDGTNNAEGYINFTKFNTAGGTISMYTLNVNANDIVCDTRGNNNKYEVYTGLTAVKDNIIKVSVNSYSSDSGNIIIPVSQLPSNYAVFYANDPQDGSENLDSTLGEYYQITDDGIKIGEIINPDKCVSFQLREWVGEGDVGSDMSEDNYIVWDSENILVDVIRDIASYRFVITPNKIHRSVDGEIILPENKEISIGLSKNIAGDGVTEFVPLTECPVGYDLYYEIDNNGPVKFGSEEESNVLPYTLKVSEVTNSIVLTLVVDENSEDDRMVVLSETVEVTSDVPGKAAYVGYLTDSMCTVSCDANGTPTIGQMYNTTFKVTNGTVTNITVPEGVGYEAAFENGKIYFKNFTQDLPEVTKLTLVATCEYSDGVIGTEEAGYTIIKLKVADASTILDFSNDNVVIPCDENGTPYTTIVTTYVAMLHGDEVLTLTSNNVVLGERDENGYYKITHDVKGLSFDENGIGSKELIFTGTDSSGNSWTRKGQITLTKLKAGESGKIGDLVLTTNSPKYDNVVDKFYDDYIEGGVNVGGSDSWEIADYSTLSTAGRYIVYKTNEVSSTYIPFNESDFVDGHFRLYINPTNSGNAYVDLDNSNGVKIALAKLEGNQYIPIQEEGMKASYDGRDFGKFELMISDEIISRRTDSNKNVTVTPTEIKVLGIYEYSGMNREQYKGGETHNQHVSGLDIYYSIDKQYNGENTVQSGMTELPDSGNNGYSSDDTLSVTSAKSNVDLYLVAHYKENDESEEILKIIDHKLVRVVTVVDGVDGEKGDKGDQGEKGEDGETPVIYKIIPSKSQIVRKNGTVASTEPITFNVYRTRGSITSNITSGFSIGILNSPQSGWNGSAKTVNPSNVYSPITIYLCESGSNPTNENAILAQCEIGYIEVNDGTDGTAGTDGKTYEHKYCVADTNDESKIRNNSDLVGLSEPNSSAMTNEVPYMWCRETLGEDIETAKYYIAAMYGKGEPGRNAAIIYPAGVGDSEVEYVVTPEKVPYVWYEVEDDAKKGYYKAKEVTEYTRLIGINQSPTTEYGEKMDYMESIYSDIGVFNQALVGKWVFGKEYMFSQEGDGSKGLGTRYDQYDDIGSAITNYIDKGETGVWFKPKTLMNAVTGSVTLSGYLQVGDKISGSYIEEGTITAAQIDTDTLKVSRLETNEGKEGSIIIVGDEITVHNIDDGKPILNITGSSGMSIKDIPTQRDVTIALGTQVVGEPCHEFHFSKEFAKVRLAKGKYNIVFDSMPVTFRLTSVNKMETYITMHGGISVSNIEGCYDGYMIGTGNVRPDPERNITAFIPVMTNVLDVDDPDTEYIVRLDIGFTFVTPNSDLRLSTLGSVNDNKILHFCPTTSSKMIQISSSGLIAINGDSYFNLDTVNGSFSMRTKEDSGLFNYMGMDKDGFGIAHNNKKYYDPYIATINDQNVLAFRSSTGTENIDL